MEQRTYRGGTGTPGTLADALVQHFDQDEHLRAQKIGQGDSVIVQIGQLEHPDRVTLTLGAHHAPTSSGEAGDLVVSLGAQQWMNEEIIGFSGMAGIIELLFTRWGQNTLLWPIRERSEHGALAHDIWQVVDSTLIGQGATLVNTETITHPHLDEPVQ